MDLSGEQKRQICIYKQENPKSTQGMIVKHLKSEWDVSLGRSTVSEVLKSKEKWLTISKEISYMLSPCVMHLLQFTL